MEFLYIYLYTVLTGLVGLSTWVLTLALIATIIFGICVFVEVINGGSVPVSNLSKYIPLKSIVIALLLVVVVPSKDDMKYIIGGGLAWMAIENVEGLAELPQNLINAANAFLKEEVKSDK